MITSISSEGVRAEVRRRGSVYPGDVERPSSQLRAQHLRELKAIRDKERWAQRARPARFSGRLRMVLRLGL